MKKAGNSPQKPFYKPLLLSGGLILGVVFFLLSFQNCSKYGGREGGFQQGSVRERPLPPPIPDDRINVQDMGAKGDGESDDTVPIQKAIQMAQEKGGGSVYFPEGIYLVPKDSYLIELNGVEDIHLVGDGIGKTVFRTQKTTCDTCFTAAVRISGVNKNISISYIEIEGTYYQYSSPMPIELGIWYEAKTDNELLDGLTISNMKIHHLSNVGVQINSYFRPDGSGPITKNIILEDNEFETVRGFVGLCSVENVKVQKNHFKSHQTLPSDDDIILCRNLSNILVEDNFHDKSGPSPTNRGRAIVVETDSDGAKEQDVVIRNNKIVNHKITPEFLNAAGEFGIFPSIQLIFGWGGVTQVFAKNIKIENNTVENGNWAIGIDGTGTNVDGTGIVVRGNTIRNMDGLGTYLGRCIVQKKLPNAVIEENHIANCGSL